MNQSDFTFIEARLGVLLTNTFKEFMAQFPNDAHHQLEGDLDILETNAELFVIGQLARINNDRGYDYYEKQPELRQIHFLDIGGDGCGNFYCMVGNDPKSQALWLWEHDPDNGFVHCKDASLGLYFGPNWRLTDRSDPFETVLSDKRIVTRANHPARSILQPIQMQEWIEYVDRSNDLKLDEMREFRNPFTSEKLVRRSWPGRAKLSTSEGTTYIMFLNGGLVLDSSATPEQKVRMRQIANDLAATLF